MLTIAFDAVIWFPIPSIRNLYVFRYKPVALSRVLTRVSIITATSDRKRSGES